MSKYGVMSVVARNQFLAVLTTFGNSLLGKSIRLGILRSPLLLSGFEVEKRRPRPRHNEVGSKFELPAGDANFREESELVAKVLLR